MRLEKQSPCKVNLLLNILGKRPDGFHELETVMHPVRIHDVLTFERTAAPGVSLKCNLPELPVDARNLVHRATTAFLEAARVDDGVSISLDKRIPLAAGLGGGSGNAATTLLGLNELFGHPLGSTELNGLAAGLGSDVPFFLQHKPALGVGRGERIESLGDFPALAGTSLVLVHPGFGVSTPWAYQNLARFPQHLNGRRGRAAELIEVLRQPDVGRAAAGFYNSLEAPVLEKYPLLALFQDFFRDSGAIGTLMSGSGSTTFALYANLQAGRDAAERFRGKFGSTYWLAVVPTSPAD